MYAWRLTLTMIDSRCHCSSMCRDLLVQPPAPVREHIRFHDAIPGQPSPLEPPAGLAARLGIFDATMVVMGGIVGSRIFINSYVVAKLAHTPATILGASAGGRGARMVVGGVIVGAVIFTISSGVANRVHPPAMILGAWVAGGLLALVGAFIYAELANRMPEVGGQYAYIREAYGPRLGFLYGWVSILVIHAGGTAAVAVTFGKYFREFSHSAVPENVAAVSVVVALTMINCVGVRAGSRVQSFFMVLRILAIVMIVGCGAWFLLRSSVAPHPAWQPLLDRPASFDLLTVFGAALIPVIL